MKIFNKYLIIAFFTLVLTSCDFDLLDSPNQVSPENANIYFLLANMYVEFSEFINSAHDATACY